VDPQVRTDDAPRERGRPRSEATHAAILAAVIPLIQELGYDAFSMETLAARAGVGKAAIYRRWSSREDLVAEAAAQFVSAIPIPDTGSFASDLAEVLSANAALHDDPESPALLSSLLAAVARSPRIASAVRAGFVAEREAAFEAVLARGRDRGEVRADIDLGLARDLCAGALLYRSLVGGRPTDAEVIARLVGQLVHGLAPAHANQSGDV